MSHRRRRRPREDWDHEIAIVPNTGAVGFRSQPPAVIAPSPVRVFIVSCPVCAWESGEATTVTEARRSLVTGSAFATGRRVLRRADPLREMVTADRGHRSVGNHLGLAALLHAQGASDPHAYW